MTTIAPGAEVPAIPPVGGETRAAKAHQALTNRWASAAAVVIAVLWTVPTAGLLISSFRPQGDVQGSGWWTFFTDPNVTLDNYKAVINGTDTDLATYFINSIVITIPAVLIPISIATMAAYAFAWMKFPGRNTLFVAVFALQIVPIQVTMIPLLSIYANPPSYPDWVPGGFVDFVAFDHAGHIWPKLAGGDAPGGGFYTIWLSHAIFALPLAIYILHNFMNEIPA
jgi:alpha-glucoside transport system permease protein